MKKLNLWFLVSLFVAVFTLSACGDDDGDKPADATNALIGTWKWTNSLDDDAATIYTLSFSNSNSFKMIEEKMFHNSLHVRWINEGSYTIMDGNKVAITVNKSYCQNPEDPEPWETEVYMKPFTASYRIDGNKLYYTPQNDSEQGPFIKQ